MTAGSPNNKPQRELVLPRWLRNTLIFPLLFLNGWMFSLLVNYFQPIISILLMSIILAIVLDFPVQFLQQRGLPRIWSLTIVIVLAVGLLPILGFVVVPILIQQLNSFINQLPQWVSSANGLFQVIDELPVAQALGISFTEIETQLTTQFVTLIRNLGSTLLGLIVTSFSGGLKVFFMIVLTIFMLIKGGRAWAGMMSWLPPWWRERVEGRVPYKFRRFIMGQITLAFGFGVVLAVIFTFIRVPLAIMFAFLIALGSLFPFMGAVTQTSVSFFVMLHSFGTGLQVFVIALVLGQILDEVILPKVMGDIVGVNPIWLIISVFLGAKVGGIMGILLAVPIASVIKNLVDDMIDDARQKSALEAGGPELITPESIGPESIRPSEPPFFKNS
ncbi:MAG: AI-2E family transporter [Leptolyngbyaceae cyanobacterium SM2_3_12]|nr:AI-2E family transporter [Leptolyngbyaceae cyanobacterium SM2_3_12]